jgi:DNA-binding response OmpR family regulator
MIDRQTGLRLIKKSASPEVVALSRAKAREMRHSTLTNSTILVVEDEPLISMDISSALEDAGAAVEVAGSVDEALFLADGHAFDGAVIDFTLGNRTAQSLCDVLISRGVPIVIYTASSVSISDPSISLLAKPAATMVLLEFVERAMERARAGAIHRLEERRHAS